LQNEWQFSNDDLFDLLTLHLPYPLTIPTTAKPYPRR